MCTLSAQAPARWTHRIAMLDAVLVFPLIWVGGLVTTYDAGMAVPDWPNTYNYNMFAYPVRDWFFGPWDLFVEHGHRILGSIVGLVCIALVVATWLENRRKWVRGWSLLILAMVIAQGVLGGQRVVRDERLLAMVHGSFGPLFFATVVAMIVFTSRWWHAAANSSDAAAVVRAGGWRPLFWAFWPAAYLQLVLGAFLRHIPVDADTTAFQTLILWHVAVALLILGLAAVAGAWSWAARYRPTGLRGPARVLSALVVVQIVLGVTTYVVKFGWPAWFHGWGFAERYVIAEKSFWQMNLITAHVAVGSLILAAATVAVCRAERWARFAPGAASNVAAEPADFASKVVRLSES